MKNLIALNSIIDLISDLTEILSIYTNHEYIFYILSFKPHLNMNDNFIFTKFYIVSNADAFTPR